LWNEHTQAVDLQNVDVWGWAVCFLWNSGYICRGRRWRMAAEILDCALNPMAIARAPDFEQPTLLPDRPRMISVLFKPTKTRFVFTVITDRVTVFGQDRPVSSPDERIELLFEKVPGGRGGYNRWTINGKSWPRTNPLFTTETGKHYRLAMTNMSGDNHPVHLHRHSFEVTKVSDKATAGVIKDTINMTRFSTVEIDFVADDPGPTLVHCHHQDHQDEGFMGLMTYP
jgi:hypothetical protein